MQHRYVPDLGDFSKFAVIDTLSGGGDLRTALIWYLVDPNEVGDAHNNDGKHTTYLDEDRLGYAYCAPELYRRFQAIHATGEKHVGVYARHDVLPNMRYFSEPLSYDDRSSSQREAWRAGWLDRALRVSQGAGLVVLDPDNGLMADRLSIRSQSAVKYATLEECKAFYADGERTLVVYQHGHRQGTIAQQADAAIQRLTNHLGLPRSSAFALRFHRGTSRCYLIVPAGHDDGAARDRAQVMVRSSWGTRGHFSLVT
ncbi:MAG: hypothetical protein AAF085_16740 [Planctomycetota bacterium]